MQRYQNTLYFKFFQVWLRVGGVMENLFFPKFKIVQIIIGRGGQENYGLFPQFVTFLVEEQMSGLHGGRGQWGEVPDILGVNDYETL